MADMNMPPEGAKCNLTPFLFEGEKVFRTITKDGETRFVGVDVCRILEIRDHKQALERLDNDERGRYDIPPFTGERAMIVVSEPGLFRLIFRSNKPVAERLKRWLAHEVLPALRRTGSYSMPGSKPQPPAELIDAPDTAENDNLKLRKVTVVRDIFGNKSARQLYRKLGLEYVPAMSEVLRQGDIFDEPDTPNQPDMFSRPAKTNSSHPRGSA